MVLICWSLTLPWTCLIANLWTYYTPTEKSQCLEEESPIRVLLCYFTSFFSGYDPSPCLFVQDTSFLFCSSLVGAWCRKRKRKWGKPGGGQRQKGGWKQGKGKRRQHFNNAQTWHLWGLMYDKGSFIGARVDLRASEGRQSCCRKNRGRGQCSHSSIFSSGWRK